MFHEIWPQWGHITKYMLQGRQTHSSIANFIAISNLEKKIENFEIWPRESQNSVILQKFRFQVTWHTIR